MSFTRPLHVHFIRTSHALPRFQEWCCRRKYWGKQTIISRVLNNPPLFSGHRFSRVVNLTLSTVCWHLILWGGEALCYIYCARWAVVHLEGVCKWILTCVWTVGGGSIRCLVSARPLLAPHVPSYIITEATNVCFLPLLKCVCLSASCWSMGCNPFPLLPTVENGWGDSGVYIYLFLYLVDSTRESEEINVTSARSPFVWLYLHVFIVGVQSFFPSLCKARKGEAPCVL